MRISNLSIYPVKSGPALPCSFIKTTERGFESDRRFMVVDDTGKFRSQRHTPILGRLTLTLRDAGGLRIEAPGQDPLTVSLPTGGPTLTTIWSDEVTSLYAGDEAARWFTELIGESSRLVWMPENSRRLIKEAEGVALSYADTLPYLLTTQASLDDLNGRIPGDPVPMAAFRPGLVVEGASAWAEDTWKVIQIGESVFDVVEDCGRCSITTLDPSKPDRPRKDGEPLRTLAKFRKKDGEVMFGRFLVCRNPGEKVSVDDEVIVLETH